MKNPHLFNLPDTRRARNNIVCPYISAGVWNFAGPYFQDNLVHFYLHVKSWNEVLLHSWHVLETLQSLLFWMTAEKFATTRVAQLPQHLKHIKCFIFEKWSMIPLSLLRDVDIINWADCAGKKCWWFRVWSIRVSEGNYEKLQHLHLLRCVSHWTHLCFISVSRLFGQECGNSGKRGAKQWCSL